MPHACCTFPLGSIASNACDSGTGTLVPDRIANRIDERSRPFSKSWRMQAAMCAGPPINTVGRICVSAATKSGGVNTGNRHAAAPTTNPSSSA